MITYLKGDATEPIETKEPDRIIAHVCNNLGGWGEGFVLALSEKWPEPERQYRNTVGLTYDTLGQVQFVSVEYRLMVANLIAQRGYATKENPLALDLRALESCLGGLYKFCTYAGDFSIHMPRIGTGLGGRRWVEIEPIIQKTLKELSVYVYDTRDNESY